MRSACFYRMEVSKVLAAEYAWQLAQKSCVLSIVRTIPQPGLLTPESEWETVPRLCTLPEVGRKPYLCLAAKAAQKGG